MVAVAYRRCSFTRGSNCKAFTGNVLVFWIGGRLRKVVAPGASTVFQRHSMFIIFFKKKKLATQLALVESLKK